MTRKNGIFKTTNEYQSSIQNYDIIPKAVFAGLVVSYLVNNQGIEFNNIDNAIREEWEMLYKNGIIPQKPTYK